MTCDQARQFLHAYLDDELDLASAVNIESHLSDCAECQRVLDSIRATSRAAVNPEIYRPAPPQLRDRIRQAIRSDRPTTETAIATRRWLHPLAFSGLAASVLLIVGSMFLFLPMHGSGGQIDALIGSHLRSLDANHLLDVESTDQHTVKPWFAGKLDFSPPVVDLAADGFPLIGGRLDYIGEKKAAALIYRRNKHLINLFIWPGDASPETDSKQGFNLIRFESRGMTCWAISDLNSAELQQFAELFQAQKAASTR